MTMQSPDAERHGDRERFDPVREGDRHRLSREVSIAIWQRVCAATDGSAGPDPARAKRQFHQVATVVGARRGRSGAGVGRTTRVGSEPGGMALTAWPTDLRGPRAPGRETLVSRIEGQMEMTPGTATPRAPATTAPGIDPSDRAAAQSEPQTDDIEQAVALVLGSPSTRPATPPDGRLAAWHAPGAGLSVWTPPTPDRRRDGNPQVRGEGSKVPAVLASSPETPQRSVVAPAPGGQSPAPSARGIGPGQAGGSMPSGSTAPSGGAAASRGAPSSGVALASGGAPDSGGAPTNTGALNGAVANTGAPNSAIANTGAPNGAVANTGAPNSAIANTGAPNGAVANTGAPNGAVANTGAPNGAVANTGAPNTGAPNGAVANTGAPNTGAPNTGAPNTGAPNTGAPNGAVANPGAPNSGGAPTNTGAPNGAVANTGAPNGAVANTGAPNGAVANTGAPNSGGAPTNTGAPNGPATNPAAPGSSSARSGATPAAAGPAGGTPTASAAPPRRGAADNLLLPEAPGALTPATAGRLQTLRHDNQGVAAATTQLPTAQQQTDVARAAVEQPQAEQDAHAQQGLVAAVDERPPPSPEIEAACARIRQVIRDKRPPSEDKLVDARPKEMAQAAGHEMSAGVEQRAGTVRQGYADMQQPPRGTPDTTPKPATVPPARAQAPSVDAAAGAPDPLTRDEVSLDGDVAAQRQKIQDAGMNTEAGQLVKDGPIGDARGDAGELDNLAKTDPEKVLADQAAAIAKAQSDMRALQAAAETALANARAGAVSQMATHTTGVKGSEEQQRAAAGAQMQAIFTRTRGTIDGLLQPLGPSAVARWEAGVAHLSTEFETSLASVKQRIDERHSGIGGFFNELGDGVFGLPDWVTMAYDAAEAKFADGATGLITDISRDVNAVVERCKQLIDQARKDIDAVVKSLPANLQGWAQGEAARLGQELDQLGQQVESTQQGLNQDLANRANGAVQEVRERVADLREQAKGLIGKIADAIAAFLKDPGRAIINGLLHLLGIPQASFWALVDKLGDVIGGIAAAPLKFANTLMAGVGQGFQQFFDNLPTNLGQALFQWLFGKLGEAGVQMPADFSIKSILTLVLEVMGVTWTRIKTLLAKHIGPQNAEILDQAIQLVTALIEKGPEGVFELIKDQLDPSMILDAIKDAVIQYVMQAIITRVTARILMMLNPAGAILQAIEAIYRVIKWVIDNAARIFTLIESIVNGAAQILAGNVSGVANLVESSLVRLIVPVIDFLAGYLGLGGIPEAIKNVILGLQKRVEVILDKVIGFVAQKAKGLWQAARRRATSKDKTGKDKTDNAKTDKTKTDKAETDKAKTDKAKTDKAKTDKAKTDKAKGGKGIKHVGETVRFTAAHHPHRLWIQVENQRPTVMVASNPVPVARQLQIMQGDRDKLTDTAKKAQAEAKLKPIESLLAKTTTSASAAVAAATSASPAAAGGSASGASAAGGSTTSGAVVSDERALADALRDAFEFFAIHSDIEAPAALKATPHDFKKLTSPLTGIIYKIPPGTVLNTTAGDPRTVAYRVRTQHPDHSSWDPATKTLTLPPVQPAVLENATSTAELGTAVARETGVSKVTLDRREQTKFTIKGAIGVETPVAIGVCGPDKRVTDAVNGVAAAPAYGRVIQFMQDMARDGTVGGLSLAKLRELCEIGVTFDWLKDKFRDGLTGKGGLHEWVPSNLMVEIVAFVNRQQAVEGLAKASRWISFQNEFRTDTSWIMFKPSLSSLVEDMAPASPGAPPTRTQFRVLNGHVGAILRNGRSCHVHQQDFHDELRDQWVLASTISQCITGMQNVVQNYVWDGQEPVPPAPPPLHPLLTDSRGRSFITELAAIMQTQAQHYRQILMLFQRMQRRYP